MSDQAVLTEERKMVPEEDLHNVENRINALIKKIARSEYRALGYLVRSSKSLTNDDIRKLLERIMTEWQRNIFSPASMHALMKFVYLCVRKREEGFSFKNRTPIPVCYYSRYIPISALLLYSHLTLSSFAVKLFSLWKTDQGIKKYIETENPGGIVLTMTHFVHLPYLSSLLPDIQERGSNIFLGGLAFDYDESLKRRYAGCVFPQSLDELVHILEKNQQRGLP